MIRIYRILGAVLLQLVFIITMILTYTNILANGSAVLMPIRGVDPRDFFRGDYIVLDYPLSSISFPHTSGSSFVAGQPVYVAMATGLSSDQWPVVSKILAISSSTPDVGLYAKATIQSVSTQQQYQYAVNILGERLIQDKKTLNVDGYQLTDRLKMILVKTNADSLNVSYLALLPVEVGFKKLSNQQGSLLDKHGNVVRPCEQYQTVTGEITYIDHISNRHLRKMLVYKADSASPSNANSVSSSNANSYLYRNNSNPLELVVYPFDPQFSNYQKGQSVTVTECMSQYGTVLVYLNNYYVSTADEIQQVLESTDIVDLNNPSQKKWFNQRDLSKLGLADDLELVSTHGVDMISLQFGADKFFVQKGSGRAIEDSLGGTGKSYAMRKVGSNGTIVVEGLLVGGIEVQ